MNIKITTGNLSRSKRLSKYDVYSAAVEYGGQFIGVDNLKDEQNLLLLSFFEWKMSL